MKTLFKRTLSITLLTFATLSAVSAQAEFIKFTPTIIKDISSYGLASATGSYNANTPDKAFDNNNNTTWGNNNVLPAALTYDLGGVQTITGASLARSNIAGWQSDAYAPVSYTFESSVDGTTWTTLSTQVNNPITFARGKVVFSFPTTTARYVRAVFTAAQNGNWVNINEMEVLGILVCQ